MTKFVCYRTNVLMDYGVQSVQESYEAATIVEAAIAYFTKHHKWPEEIYTNERTVKAVTEIENLKYRTQHIEKQRDNFAKSLTVAVHDRDVLYKEIERLHDLVRTSLHEINQRMKE